MGRLADRRIRRSPIAKTEGTMRATHWLPAHQPQMAQAIASIVMNFGSLERQLAWLLERLQDCPPNTRSAPKSTLSDTLKAIKSASHGAFGSSRLGNRIVGFAETASSLAIRRNILIHGEVVKSSEGGLVVIHTRARPRERVVYQLALEDVTALDNGITFANLDLERFCMGVADPRLPCSEDNSEMLAQLWSAMAPQAPCEIVPLTKATFPRS